MIISPTNYADFQTFVSTFGLDRNVFYFFVTASNVLQAGAFSRAGDVCVYLQLSGGAPSSFNSDFPHAVALTGPFSAA